MSHPCQTEWQRKFLNLDCYRPELQALATAVQKFCIDWYNQRGGEPTLLLMAGKPGCGKTHVLNSIYKWARHVSSRVLDAWSRPPSLVKCSWPKISDNLKDKLGGAITDLMEADLALIDDIGAEHDPWQQATDKLCQVLSARERKHTVITTNVSPEQWPQRFDLRIADRLIRNSVRLPNLFGIDSYAISSPR